MNLSVSLKTLLKELLYFLIAILSIYLTSLISEDKVYSIIAGLLVYIIGILFGAREIINKNNRDLVENSNALTEINQFHANLLSHLKLTKLCIGDEWFEQCIENLSSLRKDIANDKSYSCIRAKNIISNAIKQARDERKKSYRYDDITELERNINLKQIIDEARTYVCAVTIDIEGYYTAFWSGNFRDEYNKSNINAAKRGVKIERIFVMNKNFLEGKDRQKFESFKKTIKEQKEGGVDIYILAIEDVQTIINDSNTSFLVCDDCVVSESEGLSNGKKIERYIAYGEDKENKNNIEKLIVRFNQLKHKPQQYKI